MRFTVLREDERLRGGDRGCVLVPAPVSQTQGDEYCTLYRLWFRDGAEADRELGLVKIGYADLIRGEQPLEAGSFASLGPGYDRRLYWFSVGQNDSYYGNIRTLGPMLRAEILDGLCDIAYDEDLFDQAMLWDVAHASLLHAVTPQTVGVQFRRIAWGGLQFTDYDFSYVAPAPPYEEVASEPWRLSFAVRPNSTPPTNVHVLIGRNGVGKTTLLGDLASAVVAPEGRGAELGRIEWSKAAPGTFVNVVSVAFSAFDPAQERPESDEGEDDQAELKGWDPQNVPGGSRGPSRSRSPSVAHWYVGLAKVDEFGRPTGERMSYEDLRKGFSKSVAEVVAAGRVDRWIAALDRLGSDPQFHQCPVHSFARDLRERGAFQKEDEKRAKVLFTSLSSGHAIVLLTMTRLVETVAEASLVLLDEPEAHLHPPLLASFVRAVSDLLTDRNGVAVIATHSPVVLQEVPRSCVWKIGRWDHGGRPVRPEIETYGENVGILTHEVFGLEVAQSGVQAEIEKAVRECGSYEEVLARFGGQLGGEAKGLVRILLAYRERR
ncbi:ATP-binding protein [Streptomyces sp. NBC_01174]|uniref:ATP-binding protein n=1 Tax=Streptomyces sp. NBC_01174 TaxID=2903758 RepID=UPI00386BDB95|nr:ATP-binding protein [Streptomyces sp. NBC_01175]WSS73283.1 ATP-binding protein [Streptomyces sp. NBC_01175]WSS73769.1 ATP-binding protein [Streptomyces sp. NBC_01174]WSS80823.1 ATP-binding protein [Streptomyces sp. NBC_01174]